MLFQTLLEDFQISYFQEVLHYVIQVSSDITSLWIIKYRHYFINISFTNSVTGTWSIHSVLQWIYGNFVLQWLSMVLNNPQNKSSFSDHLVLSPQTLTRLLSTPTLHPQWVPCQCGLSQFSIIQKTAQCLRGERSIDIETQNLT